MTDRHDIWHNFFPTVGTLGHPVLLRTTSLSNWNRKLIRDVYGRHFEYCSDVIYADDGPIHITFGVPMQNEMPMVGRLKS